ncbi:LOW QUALITY PROTEIN: olfactory receptor 10G3-like [Tachyglossus aculeatus]|uniref:LOW QUALITY PROTEIN: olfactory receptor 10G3-like n=1 Tax=Tachyglossus aculeatus TaxID=9261 RepID=UPI0018F43997|nr:LOW QUALITY PROTEIN: olfactory receptor 10G3-like [Tachyglossus aculeatus]
MERANGTLLTEFILAGLPHPPKLRVFLFLFFLATYTLTQLGNLLILLVVSGTPQLRARPMYIFLGVLSVIDMSISTLIVPRMLTTFTATVRPISYAGCVAQLYGYHFLGSTQCFLYTIMAYDRYLAICHPLRYPAVMTRRACSGLAAGPWAAGSVHGAIQASLTFHLPYCGPNKVDHFLCDIPAVLKLACADTAANELVTLMDVGAVASSCFLLILLSYARIIRAVLAIRTASGRRRAFSTCGSHMTLVTMYYVPCAFIYLQPDANSPLGGAAALFPTAITPLLNPLIYTLRNQEVKRALKRMMAELGGRNGF